MLCCAPSCWARDAVDRNGVPLCPAHFDAVAQVVRAEPWPGPEPVVYYITRVDRPGQVKIGTTKNLRTRLTELGRRGRTVTLIATEPGGRDLERQRHAEFAAIRADGEWFSYAAPIIAHIDRLVL